MLSKNTITILKEKNKKLFQELLRLLTKVHTQTGLFGFHCNMEKPHLLRRIMNKHLQTSFPGHVISSNETALVWPPRSPDLNTSDFFLMRSHHFQNLSSRTFPWCRSPHIHF